jgi:CheY-like chemotaxis protein
VLLAEDNSMNIDLMRQMLGDLGHEVEVATNGFEALEKLQGAQARFDVVLMDVMMPGLDGASATRRLRASDAAGRDIPVIACSAHVGQNAAARYRAEGMDAFLPKPVDRATLRAVLASVTDPGGTARAGAP